jgi:hypothetical protein
MDVPNELLRAARAAFGLMQIEVCKFCEGRCRTTIGIEKIEGDAGHRSCHLMPIAAYVVTPSSPNTGVTSPSLKVE